MRTLTTTADVVRGIIGCHWLAAGDDATDDDAAGARAIGSVVLHAHQRRAVSRLRRSLADEGGALLADAVGMGKTFVALALAREAASTLVVAPAALRATWRRAAERCGVSIRFASIESLGRADRPLPDPAALVVVDEAHHARNPATRRWRRLAELCVGARVLLLTATPVHNHAGDLRALFRLFLGARADTLDGDALLRLVVRRAHRDVDTRSDAATSLPRLEPTRWRALPADPRVADALARIPPPLPVAGGTDAEALWRMTLVRQWGSSDAALRAALRRRLAVAAALEAALAEGRRPTRQELRAWCYDEGALQLAMPLLVADHRADGDVTAMRDVVAAHEDAVRGALRVLDERGDRDARRAAWLRAVRRRHAGRTIVAFTYSAATAAALYRRLRADGAVAMLTARGGTVAGGTLTRAELLARFAPQGAGVPPPRAAERVDLLIATDCLSEGLDLRDASVVVHLDVPWTPARLAQRVGRAARLGSVHAAIAVHALAPPSDVDARLSLARRLRRKARAARRAGGSASPRQDASDAERAVWLGRELESWAARTPAPGAARDVDAVAVAAVAAPRSGFIAAIDGASGPRLLVGGRAGAWDDVRTVARTVRRAGQRASDLPLDAADAARALRRVRRRIRAWEAGDDATRAAGLDPTAGPTVRAALARLARVAGEAPPERRTAVATAIAPIRARLREPLPAATERAVRALLVEPTLAGSAAHEGWLARLAATLGPVRGSAARAPGTRENRVRLVAVLLLRRVQTIRRSDPSEPATTDEPDRHAGGHRRPRSTRRRPAAVRAE